MNEQTTARPAQKPNVIKSPVAGLKLDQQNIRTELLQPIKCFYGCCFTTTESKAMEKHYKKEHRSQAREVVHG